MRKSIYDMVQDVKRIEQEELLTAMKLHGTKTENGLEYHFEDDNPIIACYGDEDPFDAVIMSVKAKGHSITLVVEDKNNRYDKYEIDVDNVFAGQLEFVSAEIYALNS